MSRPMVSVVMITYGHEKFISEAINGILMQVCNFSIELIIANDNSPDLTHDIILGLLKKHPNASCVRYIKHEKNLGMMPNFIYALKQAKGKYIALCEGDDYWTDPLKLEKQVDFLEKNPSFAICFHKANIHYENGIPPFLEDINAMTTDETTIYNILKGNYIHTASVLFINNEDYPTWMTEAYPGDWALHIINSTYGKIKYLREAMATYRVHFGGIHSTTGGHIEQSLSTFENVCKELERRSLFNEAIFARYHYNYAFAVFYGLRKGVLLNFTRIQKSKILFQRGNIKLKALFWVPLLLNNSSHLFYDFLIKLKNKTKS